MNTLRVSVAVLLTLATLAGVPAHAASDIYMYKRPDGSRAYSDRVPRYAPYVRIENTGRPTASASCMGLTTAALESRAANYQSLILKYAQTHEVSPALVRAVVRVESCFDRRAVSRSGARGLMQLMPQTAALLDVKDSFDAEQNINGGVRYLKMMLQRFNQNTSLALAAYNAGPTAVADHQGIPPFPETRSYVQRVLADYKQNLKKNRGTETPHAPRA